MPSGSVFISTFTLFEVPPGFTFEMPSGPDESLTGGPEELTFDGPGSAGIHVRSMPVGDVALRDISEQVRSNIEQGGGGVPERSEDIRIDGLPALLLTYHFQHDGVGVHELVAISVREGRAYEIGYANESGNEAADRALMTALLASFEYMR
jgi:hypothetical protein